VRSIVQGQARVNPHCKVTSVYYVPGSMAARPHRFDPFKIVGNTDTYVREPGFIPQGVKIQIQKPTTKEYHVRERVCTKPNAGRETN